MEDEIQYKSKTAKKKEAEELQKLGLELSKLSVSQLENIDISEKLRTALIEDKSITSNIASRRHRQFIGVLMRDINPESIRLALLKAEDKIPVEFENMKETRLWIEKLLIGDLTEIETLLCEFPGIERQRLRQLVRNIKKEKPEAKTSKSRKALEQLIMTEMSSR
jgi:ribosome-associated protein